MPIVLFTANETNKGKVKEESSRRKQILFQIFTSQLYIKEGNFETHDTTSTTQPIIQANVFVFILKEMCILSIIHSNRNVRWNLPDVPEIHCPLYRCVGRNSRSSTCDDHLQTAAPLKRHAMRKASIFLSSEIKSCF